MNDPANLVRELAATRGFHVLGITLADADPDAAAALADWCATGRVAGMGWMGRDPAARADPKTLLPRARSIVAVALDHGVPSGSFAAEGHFGRVARYAWGGDYHDVVLERLGTLASELVAAVPGASEAKVACDHSPLMERALAARAGLGFFGKNTCLLLPRRGSFVFLAEILIDVELEPTAPLAVDTCGTCRACLDACPTAAFPAPFVLDARACISYLTIEHRGPIPRELRPKPGAWVFGCDICQDVCPFNRFAVEAAWPELRAEAGVGPRLDLAEALAIASDDAFRDRFAGTPLLRPKRRGLLRNAAVAARNVSAHAAVPALVACVEHDPEPLVRAHALWALFGLAPAEARALAERPLATDPDPDVRAEAEAGLDEETRT